MRYTISFLLVLKLVVTQGQNLSLNQGTVDQQNYLIVLPYENLGGKIIVPIEINSVKYRFLFDTGSPMVLSKATHDALSPSLLKKVQLVDQSGKTDYTDMVSLKEITLGKVTFRNTPTIVNDNYYLFKCFEVDGILGSNILRNALVQISPLSKTIIITDDALKIKT